MGPEWNKLFLALEQSLIRTVEAFRLYELLQDVLVYSVRNIDPGGHLKPMSVILDGTASTLTHFCKYSLNDG